MRLTPAKTPFRYTAVARGAHARKVAPPRYPEDSSSGLSPRSESSAAPIGVAAAQGACDIIPASPFYHSSSHYLSRAYFRLDKGNLVVCFRCPESGPMSRRKLPHLSIALFLASTILTAAAQSAPRACPAPPVILSSTQPNIFGEQQEQWLGDAMADMLESDSKPVQDLAENEYLARITKRLLAALPPTTIQFRVILVDSPEVNGFSLAGGRVYLTRKLVANANSEDEVASVLAHEMGHILSHQFATETTADLKRLLNITSVGDNRSE